jgi:GNAT superfamily N-acetyltransferase
MSRRNKRRAKNRVPSPPAVVAPSLTIREPESEGDLEALHLLMMMQGAECAPVPVNPAKVRDKVTEACANPDSHWILLAVQDGHLAGFLNLCRSGFWYSDAAMVMDWGFYVLPAHRNGDVGPALLQEARRIADQQGLPLYIFVNNPTRRRGAKSTMERAAALLSFVPSGAVLAFGEPAP